MKDGAFAVQLVGTAPDAKFMRRVNEVGAIKMEDIEKSLKHWLGFS